MGKKPTKKAAAKTESAKDTATATADTKTGQGSAVVLPNGVRRIDYIRDQYYTNGVHTEGKDSTRGEIRKSINEMLEKAGRKDEQIPYQIVFAACKKDVDPRTVAKDDAKAEDKPAAKAKAGAKK